MTELNQDLGLYEAVLGQKARVVTDADAVLAALQAGETGLPLEIPGETPAQTRHLMLAGLEGDQIRYAESAGDGTPAVPGGGWQTMPAAELRRLLALPGAAALLFAGDKV